MAISDPSIRIGATDNTRRAFRSVRTSLGNLRSQVFNMQSALAGLVGAAGFGALIKNTLDAQDKIGKLSQRLGASTEALSQYQFVAERTGVSFETLTMGMQRATRRISEAAAGGGEAVKALQELNLSAQDLNELAPEKQFEILADALMDVENSADQVRLAMKLFDSEGVALIQTMQGGSAEIQRLREKADELNLTLSQDNVNAAARAKDAMTELQGRMNGLSNELTVNLAPALADILKTLADYVPKVTKLASSITDKLGTAFASLYLYLFPSEIEGRKSFAEHVSEATRALNEMKTAAEAAAPQAGAIREMILPQVGPADDIEEEARQEKVNKRREKQLAELWRFEQEKNRILQHAVLDRTKFETLSAKNKTKQVVGEAIKLTRGVTGESRKLFEINKIAGIANAIINTHEGISETLATYPWPLAGAMAALHAAAGFAEVSAIKSASFSGGGGGGGRPTGGGAVPVPPSDFATAPDVNAGPQQISITVEGTGIMTREQTEQIAESLAELIQDGGSP